MEGFLGTGMIVELLKHEGTLHKCRGPTGQHRLSDRRWHAAWAKCLSDLLSVLSFITEPEVTETSSSCLFHTEI